MSHSFQSQIPFIRGETPTLRYTFKQVNGQPLDLTGATLTLNVKANLTDDTTLFSKALTITDAKAGTAKVSLTATETDREGAFYSEVKITYSDGTVLKPSEAQIELHIGPSVKL